MRNRVMGQMLLGATALATTVLALGAAAPVAPASAADPQASQNWAFLKEYCSKCHNAEDWAGGIAYETMTPQEIPQDAKVWEHAVRKLQGRLMPPPGNPQPAQGAVDTFVSWMEGSLDRAAAMHQDPGRVALHRLNRTEYADAVWDLVRVRVDPETVLPPDDQSDGFDNVANVLQVSPSFLDQYLAAARDVAVTAIGDKSARAVGTQYRARNAGTQYIYEDGLPLGTRGGFQVTHNFPADGEYELNIGNLAAALWVFNMEFQHTLIATLDGKKIFETKIGGDEDMKSIDQKQDPAVDAINARLKGIRFQSTAGPHKVAVTFIHHTYAESDDRFYQQFPGGGQDKVLRIASFEVKGPFKVTGLSATPSRQRIFICEPKTEAEETPCATRILSALVEHAFRRPVTAAEVDPFVRVYSVGRASGDFDAGIRRALTAVLASPFFLYRAEPAPMTVKAGEPYRITDLELASRLSFFLWSSLPDQQLIDLAAANRLHEPATLQAQVRRMLADPRSQSLATNFAYQWLNVGRLSEITPDPNIFPYAGDPREDYRTEIRMFVDSIFREDHNVLDLLTANYTFVNQRLAELYGINDVRGDQFRRVVLTDSHRFGLLGKGAMLMGSSYPNRTAPVLRGEWILDRITGTPPASPPPAVPSLKENKTGEQAHTVREMMVIHRSKPSCFACHGVLDPLGLALENFDAVGVWRTKDRIAQTPIDASGVLPDGTKVNGVDDLRKALVARPQQFVQTLTEKLMTYALGRTVDYSDMPTVRAIVRAAARDDYRFSSIVLNIVNSEPFQMRSLPAPSPTPVKQAALTWQHPEE
ncbi:MAG TPA: DUF1592 domain-containing protein [Steroidobacteraceae bacterium]|nr:DUF1592 domain-containing protein [Steroidobacteraceae bacterium]